MSLSIKSITGNLIALETRESLRISTFEPGPAQVYLLVHLVLSDGTEGFGEGPEAPFITGETADTMVSAVNRHLSPKLIGRDALDVEDIHATMNRVLAVGNSTAKSAIDLALYDAIGKHLGLPVCRLLGGAPRGPVASSKAIGAGPVEEVMALAQRYLADGFKTVKIKTAVDAATELAAIRAIREAVGPDLHIKLDANQGWTYVEALSFLDKAAKYDIQMIEQPLPAGDLRGMAELRRRISMPLMLDESIHGPGDALRAIEIGACDYINIKLMKSGGLFPALAIAAVCEAAGVACQIGSLSTSIGTAAAIHLVHARSVLEFAEINWPSRLFSDVGTGFHLSQGSADVDPSPGLGITVDRGLFQSTCA